MIHELKDMKDFEIRCVDCKKVIPITTSQTDHSKLLATAFADVTSHDCDLPEELMIAIAESRYMLDLEYDYDDNRAEPPSRKTWDRAINWLKFCFKLAKRQFDVQLATPHINQCADGSVDIHWVVREEGREKDAANCLVNISWNTHRLSYAYGTWESDDDSDWKDSKDGNACIQDFSSWRDLLEWLAENCISQ